MISGRRRYKFLLGQNSRKKQKSLSYPSAKGRRRLKPICLAMNFRGASDGDFQTFTGPPKQALCWILFGGVVDEKLFPTKIVVGFCLFSVDKWNVADHLKRVFPKFEAERSHPRGVNGRSKFRKKIDVDKWNVGNRPKRILAKFGRIPSLVWEVNGDSKIVHKLRNLESHFSFNLSYIGSALYEKK